MAQISSPRSSAQMSTGEALLALHKIVETKYHPTVSKLFPPKGHPLDKHRLRNIAMSMLTIGDVFLPDSAYLRKIHAVIRLLNIAYRHELRMAPEISATHQIVDQQSASAGISYDQPTCSSKSICTPCGLDYDKCICLFDDKGR